MKPNWSLKQFIQNRVNQESLYEWALDTTSSPKPRLDPVLPRLKHSTGLWNFYRGIIKVGMNSLRELRP